MPVCSSQWEYTSPPAGSSPGSPCQVFIPEAANAPSELDRMEEVLRIHTEGISIILFHVVHIIFRDAHRRLRTDCHAVSALYALRRIHRLAILYVNLSGRTVLCTESASDTFFSVYYNHSTSPFLFLVIFLNRSAMHVSRRTAEMFIFFHICPAGHMPSPRSLPADIPQTQAVLCSG